VRRKLAHRPLMDIMRDAVRILGLKGEPDIVEVERCRYGVEWAGRYRIEKKTLSGPSTSLPDGTKCYEVSHRAGRQWVLRCELFSPEEAVSYLMGSYTQHRLLDALRRAGRRAHGKRA